MYLVALMPAEAPSPTAVAICLLPPVRSPATKHPGISVSRVVLFFTLTKPFFVSSKPKYFARSELGTVPAVTKMPDISKVFSSPVFVFILSFSTVSPPLTSRGSAP